MYETRNDLSKKTRQQVIELMNSRLADAIDLKTQTKQAHWNVKGPSFIALHELFDQIAASVEEYGDLIAERVVQLGGKAAGTARIVAQRSSLEEYPAEIGDESEHVEALANALAAFGKTCRQAIDLTSELGDADAADIFTEISRGIDKYLWFVEAHGQA